MRLRRSLAAMPLLTPVLCAKPCVPVPCLLAGRWFKPIPCGFGPISCYLFKVSPREIDSGVLAFVL